MRARSEPAVKLHGLLQRAMRARWRVLLLGMGNELLADDAVGHLVAQDLTSHNNEQFLALPVGVAVENGAHMVRRFGAQLVVVVDAIAGSPRARRPWLFVPTSRLDTFCHSTHSVPLSLLARIWRAEVPGLRARFVGVRIANTVFGDPLSPSVEVARAEIVNVFCDGLAGWT